MGFYIRKSISAGPFRFNLSRGGVGLSVGVKGFRVGTGPRGNYVHMGRGGLYYRASLGGTRRSTVPSVPTPRPDIHQPMGESLSVIESGDVLAMKPANGSDIVDQINEKMAMLPFWPWAIAGGGLLSGTCFSELNNVPITAAVFILSMVLSALIARFDQQRKTVVIMYDLDDEVTAPFKNFTENFEKLASVSRVWNVDTAQHTDDWKHNAGVGQLVTRQNANLSYSVPRVVKTNLPVPAIIGGRQNLHFFPDVVLIVEGKRVGAVSYDQLSVTWNTTIFVENDAVPSDAEVVGHTWRFVNKNGGPDRRFNNNRQLPKVRYLEMELKGPERLQKIIQFSRVLGHAEFDAALSALRGLVRKLLTLDRSKNVQLQSTTITSDGHTDESFAGGDARGANTGLLSDAAKQFIRDKPEFWEYKLTVELLRIRVRPIVARWCELEEGQYKLPGTSVPRDQVAKWCQNQLDVIQAICSTFSRLVNKDLPSSWGPPGKPGDPEEICAACEQLTECARRMLEWEENVHFSAVPRSFTDVRKLLCGIAGRMLDQMVRISDELGQVFSQEHPSGTHRISLVVDLPDGWAEDFNAALTKSMRSS